MFAQTHSEWRRRDVPSCRSCLEIVEMTKGKRIVEPCLQHIFGGGSHDIQPLCLLVCHDMMLYRGPISIPTTGIN